MVNRDVTERKYGFMVYCYSITSSVWCHGRWLQCTYRWWRDRRMIEFQARLQRITSYESLSFCSGWQHMSGTIEMEGVVDQHLCFLFSFWKSLYKRQAMRKLYRNFSYNLQIADRFIASKRWMTMPEWRLSCTFSEKHFSTGKAIWISECVVIDK